MTLILMILSFMMFSPATYADEIKDDDLSIICDNYSAEYVAGVDVHGSEVVSADINDATAILVDPIIIPLRIDIAERFALDLPKSSIAEPIISNIAVYADGRVKYNGDDINVSVQQLCEFHAESVNNITQEHRQKEGNPLPSSDKKL